MPISPVFLAGFSAGWVKCTETKGAGPWSPQLWRRVNPRPGAKSSLVLTPYAISAVVKTNQPGRTAALKNQKKRRLWFHYLSYNNCERVMQMINGASTRVRKSQVLSQ